MPSSRTRAPSPGCALSSRSSECRPAGQGDLLLDTSAFTDMRVCTYCGSSQQLPVHAASGEGSLSKCATCLVRALYMCCTNGTSTIHVLDLWYEHQACNSCMVRALYKYYMDGWYEHPYGTNTKHVLAPYTYYMYGMNPLHVLHVWHVWYEHHTPMLVSIHLCLGHLYVCTITASVQCVFGDSTCCVCRDEHIMSCVQG